MLAARSGCETSMPLSITPITTLREPVVTFHASGASMSASATPPDCPVLCRPQSWDRLGSLGINDRVRAKSGSSETIPCAVAPQAATSFVPPPGVFIW